MHIRELKIDAPIFTVARVITAGLLFWALARHPIGYYTVLRVIVCAVCLYGVYLAIQWKQAGWAFPFGAIAVLFNPLMNLRMTRATWAYADVLAGIILLATTFLLRPNRQGVPTVK